MKRLLQVAQPLAILQAFDRIDAAPLRLHRKHALLLTCLASTALLQPSDASVQKVLSAVYEVK